MKRREELDRGNCRDDVGREKGIGRCRDTERGEELTREKRKRNKNEQRKYKRESWAGHVGGRVK